MARTAVAMMRPEEIQELVLKTSAELADIRRTLSRREERIATMRAELAAGTARFCAAFDRDGYKGTDQRLLTNTLAAEALIVEKLGEDPGWPLSHFLIGINELLAGRNVAARNRLDRYTDMAPAGSPNLQDAYYLKGMIGFNRREYTQATECFELAFRHSPGRRRDWQARTYVVELLSLVRKPKDAIESAIGELRHELNSLDRSEAPNWDFLYATFCLKAGNAYAGTLLPPKAPNPMVDNAAAIRWYKAARKACPPDASPTSLLPVTIDYSLAQALVLANSFDMELAQSPAELFANVFQRLRRIVLTKREEIILAQSYFMLGTCAEYSDSISRDMAKIYLEHARHQTLTVPSDVCFYSCVTKELLDRNDFVKQIDFYTDQLER
jgi:tetratricopeptide (TPR) repeat protein